MSLKHTIKLINTHPITSNAKFKTYIRIIKWQIAQAILRRPIVMPFVNDSVLLAEKGMTGATGNIYFGLHEFNDMAFLLHFLNKDDLFFDVGANIGAYTILSSKVCGAKSFSFEPAKITYERLYNNIFLNRLEKLVTIFNLGVSAKSEIVNFSKGFDTVNHITSEAMEYTEKIETVSLNEICKNNDVIPSFIKIDVEGFEQQVIEGSSDFLKDKKLQAIIIELNGSGSRYGYDEEQIHRTLTEAGFQACSYDPFQRKITRQSCKNNKDNTLYIKDIEEARIKVNKSESYTISSTVL